MRQETTTQNDIDMGIVNIIVGFAPRKPAEFVIIKIWAHSGSSSGSKTTHVAAVTPSLLFGGGLVLASVYAGAISQPPPADPRPKLGSEPCLTCPE